MGKLAQSEARSQSPPPYLVRFVCYYSYKRRRPDLMTAYGYVLPLIEAGLLPNDFEQFSTEIQQIKIRNCRKNRVLIEVYQREEE